MTTIEIPELPIQFQKTLKDYKAAFVRYQEMRAMPGTNFRRLDALWKKNQGAALRIEGLLIERHGKEVAERMLESATGWRSLPRV